MTNLRTPVRMRRTSTNAILKTNLSSLYDRMDLAIARAHMVITRMKGLDFLSAMSFGLKTAMMPAMLLRTSWDSNE